MTDNGIPDILRDTFDFEKNYLGSISQHDKHLQHWAVNSSRQEIIEYILKSIKAITGDMKLGSNAGVVTSRSSNNLVFGGGDIVNSGRVINLGNGSSFDYFDNTTNTPDNYILKGVVSSASGSGSSWTFEDNNKTFVVNHDLVGAEVMFTSGALDGTGSYVITSYTSDTFTVTGALGSVVVTDSYVIIPRQPDLTTGVAHYFTLVTWFENVNSGDDPSLKYSAAVNPSLNEEPDKKKQLRWCIYNNWSGVQDSGSLSSGHRSTNLVAYVLSGAEDLSNAETFLSIFGTFENTGANIFAIATNLVPLYAWYTISKSMVNKGFTSDTELFPFAFTATDVKYDMDIYNDAIYDYSLSYSKPPSISTQATSTLSDGETLMYIALEPTFKTPTYTEGVVVTLDEDTVPITLVSKTAGSIESIYNFNIHKEVIGLDFCSFYNGANYITSVMPGQITIGGKTYYNTTTSSFGTKDLGRVYFGSLPTNGFIYLYALTNYTGTNDNLDFYFSTEAPDYHGMIQGKHHIIGCIYYSDGDPVDCFSRNGVIAYDAPLIHTHLAGTTNLALPSFVSEGELSLVCTQGVAPSSYIYIKHSNGGSYITTKTLYTESDNERFTVRLLPKVTPSDNIELTAVDSTMTIQVYLEKLYLNRSSTPDTTIWGK